MKIEICVSCGFVHRDDRTKTRQKKTHYHWETTEMVIDDYTIHPTVCHACVTEKIDWREFGRARQNTPDKFYLRDAYNASLPETYNLEELNQRYMELVQALKADWEQERNYTRYIE